MGQFGNQPDFGTQALTIVPQGDAITEFGGVLINPPCALYVGTGGDILATVVGGDDSSPYGSQATLFKGVPSGTFMPVMISYLWDTAGGDPVTTAADIVGLR